MGPARGCTRRSEGRRGTSEPQRRRRPVEIAEAVKRGQKHQRVELEENRDGKKEAGEHRLFAIAGEEREGNEGHGGGVEMTRAGYLPDDDGAPGVEERLLAAHAKIVK